MIFPTKMCHTIKNNLASPYSFMTSSNFRKYLGVNISPNKLNPSDYAGLVQRTIHRIRGWHGKLLNMAGRCTLIKYVLNSYHVYNMQTTILPHTVISSLEKQCKNFLWNKVDHTQYLSRTSWDYVTKPMELGGLGIGILRELNLSFMAKLGWTMLTGPKKLWVKIMNDKYLNIFAFFLLHSKIFSVSSLEGYFERKEVLRAEHTTTNTVVS